MLSRLTHAAIAFAIVVVVYQVYVVVAAPFVDPTAGAQLAAQVDTPQTKPTRAVHKHRELLAAYFPVGHWTLGKPPKTIINKKTLIVLDDYQPRDDGQIRVSRCAIVFFPRGRVRGQTPPRDAVVLEVPSGAVFQMDDSRGPGPGGMGRIQWGKLLGETVVRSDMREPGPQDDLLVTTRDLYLNEDLIRTDAKVRMKLGPHRASGRVLEIRLVANARSGSQAEGAVIGGIDSLDIVREVKVQIAGGNVRLFGDSAKTQAGASPAPPIHIRSQGPFRFDFSNYVASFEKKVRAAQLHASGHRDQLDCDQLNLYFARKEDMARSADAAPDSIVPTPTRQLGMVALRPATLEAKGTEGVPVELEAPSQQAAARCDRLRIELDARQITFDGPSEVSLKLGKREIHAPMIRYQHPPKNSPHRLGTMLAAGAGWLKAVTDEDRPDQLLEVRWSKEMRLQRHEGQSVLSILGRPRLEMIGLGRLTADQLHLYLRERAEGSENEADRNLPGDIVPDRLLANGHVAIDSAEVTGRVNQLAVWIGYESSGLLLARPDGNNSNQIRRQLGQQHDGRQRAYQISGDTLRLQMAVRDSQTEISDISVDGNVDFREAGEANQKAQQLRIAAHTLRVQNADTPSAKIEIRGWPRNKTSPARPAQVQAGEMALRAQLLRLNRGSSRAWIDSPGEMQMMVARDLGGKLLPQPQPMTITWQQGMELDHDRITFRKNVLAHTTDGSLRTERLVAQLSAPIQFDGASQTARPELAQIECWEGVEADFTEQDTTGPTSRQHFELESIVANQVTGVIQGVGPGHFESTQLTDGASPLVAIAGGSRRVERGAAASKQQAQRLRYLYVEFTRALEGNLLRRRIAVVGDAKAIYGPVDSWEQKLERNVRQGPGPDTFWIDSDRLGIAENPLARLDRSKRLGPLELSATGRVTIEGSAPKGGTFTARGRRASYDQQKMTFVLEGDTRTPATFAFQKFAGAPLEENSARKLTYYQATGDVKLEDARLQFNQFETGRRGNAPGQPGTR